MSGSNAGLDAFVADALDAAADLDHRCGEPAGNVEPVEDMCGVPEMLADGFAV
jgi:hypothetical protein